MDKTKEFVKILKNIYKNPRGKAFLFFGVYFFFFLFLILAIRSNNAAYNTTDNKTDYLEITWVDNYKYDYKVIIDNNTYNYSGIRYEEINKFTYNDTDYYCNDAKCYLDKGEEDPEEIANPCIHSNILNISNFKKLINSATKDSTTNYEDGKVGYKYLLSTSTIVKKIDKKDVDLDDLPNSIYIVYKDNVEESMEIDLTSYGKYKGICTNSLKIVVEFKEQGNIDLNSLS